MQSIGAKLLASLLDGEKGTEQFLKMGLTKEMFPGAETDIFEYVETHVAKHGVLPERSTIEAETGDTLPSKAPEPPTYYLEHVEKRYLQQTLKHTLLDAEGHLKKKEPQEALSIIQDMVLDLNLVHHRKEIVNFTDEAAKMVHDDWVQKQLQLDEYGIKTGLPYLDGMTGGLVGGDLLSIVGRPASGKTYNLLHMAHHVWAEQHKTPLIISMEMKPLPLIHRIAAMHGHVPITKLKNATLTTKTYETKVKGLLQVLPEDKPPFWIIDGNLTASVKDIVLLVRQLKPDAVYVDGAYMLQAESKFARAAWERIKDTCEGLKQRVASDLDVPVLASYQFNRDQTKTKNMEATGLEHIAGGDAIGQLSSIVLGLFEDETPETKRKKHVQFLKGRNGEQGGFTINWLFDTWPFMDFSEIVEVKPEDLQFM